MVKLQQQEVRFLSYAQPSVQPKNWCCHKRHPPLPPQHHKENFPKLHQPFTPILPSPSLPHSFLAPKKPSKLVSDKSAKSKIWKEHFEQLLNHPLVAVPNLPAGPREDDVQLCSVPSLAKVSAAVKRLRNGKAPGLCGISAEMLKVSGHAGMQ